MNALGMLKNLWDDVFSAKAQQDIATTVETDATYVANIGQKVLSVAAVAVLAATASGVLKGEGAQVAATAVSKLSSTVTALQGAPADATTVGGLLSDAGAVAQALPIGTNDQAHVQSAIDGLKLLFAGTSAAAAVVQGSTPAPVAVASSDGSAATPVVAAPVPESSAG